MITSINRLEETLRSHGLSVTKVRKLVFTTIENSDPLTMSELCKVLSVNIDRASVYRTVALFEKINVTQRITVEWKYKIELSNEFQEHHHHISCLSCGKLISFHEHERIETQLAEIANHYGFDLSSHQIELQGVCESCQKKHRTPATLC